MFLQLFLTASHQPQCTVFVAPGIMVQELLNYNQGLALRCCPALCSVSQGEEGPFQRKLWGCQHPHCHSLSLRHCAGFAHWLGVQDCNFPSVIQTLGAVWQAPGSCSLPKSDHEPFVRATEPGDGAVTVNTGQELASALQSLMSTPLERMWRQPPFCRGTLPCTVCSQRTSDSCAVTARCPGAGGIWIRTFHPTECLH